MGLLERRVAPKKIFVELPHEALRIVAAWRFDTDRDFQRVRFVISHLIPRLG